MQNWGLNINFMCAPVDASSYLSVFYPAFIMKHKLQSDMQNSLTGNIKNSWKRKVKAIQDTFQLA